jgi:hypothetical protein
MFKKLRYIDLTISLLITSVCALIVKHLIELKNCDEIGGEVRNFSCNHFHDTYYVLDPQGVALIVLFILAFTFFVYVLLGKIRRS